MFKFLTISKALADENRLRIIIALRGRELCVCQLIELLELAPSTVSRHLSILKTAHLIECRKKGRWIYSRLAGEDASSEVREAISWVCNSLASTPTADEDARQLECILAIDAEDLCVRQSCKQGTVQPSEESGLAIGSRKHTD
jgi:DNA-binding transcriptional ArsR family regulator